MASKTFTVQSAGHTGFTVSSLSKALTFWHDLLGIPIEYQTTEDSGPGPNVVGVPNAIINIALLSLSGGHQVELLEYTSPDDRTVYKPRPCDVGNVHLAINVKNCENLMAEAKKIGWNPVADEPIKKKRHDGHMWSLIYLHGPDGETVELLEKHED